MKDYVEMKCEYCSAKFQRPYPSMQENPPLAPTKEQLADVNRRVLQDYIYHQNHNHCLLHGDNCFFPPVSNKY